MSRKGASRADIDTGLFHDDKVVKLARLHRDSARTAISMMLHQAAILASWKADRPMLLVDAAPAWYLDDPAEMVADLITVGLLDADGRIPAATLDEWMRSYRASVEGGHLGATKRWGANGGPKAGAMPSPPTSPPERARPRARDAQRADEPTKIEPMKTLREIAVETGGFIGQMVAQKGERPA